MKAQVVTEAKAQSKISKMLKARETPCDRAVIASSFEFDWLRKWNDFSEPITEGSEANQ